MLIINGDYPMALAMRHNRDLPLSIDEVRSAPDISRGGGRSSDDGGTMEQRLTYLFIAHDLSVVRHVSDRIAVMYLGKIVEQGEADTVYKNPKRPYTQALLSAVPIADPIVERKRQRVVLKGDMPSPLNPPKGCVFNTRRPIAGDECFETMPEAKLHTDGRRAACHEVEVV